MKFFAALSLLTSTLCVVDAFVPTRPALFVTTPTSQATTTTTYATVATTNGASPNGASTTSASSSNPTVAAVPKVAQRWRKSTKQVITLGPASSTPEMIETLFLAGADVFRLNFSHGSQEQKKELLDMIRAIEEKYSHPIAILGDLQGPKLRVSTCYYCTVWYTGL